MPVLNVSFFGQIYLRVYPGCPASENSTKNLAYNRPRDWRLSAPRGPNYRPPETPPTSHWYDIEGFKGTLNWASNIPRGVRLLVSRCNCFCSVSVWWVDKTYLSNIPISPKNGKKHIAMYYNFFSLVRI